MKETIRLILTPALICLLAGGLLEAVNTLTRDRILDVTRGREQTAMNTVLPAHDNAPGANRVRVSHNGREWTFFVARRQKAFAGAAVEASSPEGYGGEIRLMLGIGADGKTIGIAILDQKETPGLGANIATPDFALRLADRDIRGTDWRVKKDGGDIDHITAATISSRAVASAVRNAIEAYAANLDTIRSAEN